MADFKAWSHSVRKANCFIVIEHRAFKSERGGGGGGAVVSDSEILYMIQNKKTKSYFIFITIYAHN